MPTINENFLKLEKNYLFINIAKKVNAFLKEHPEADLIRMGIGDVTLPIAPVCVEAMKKGAEEMAGLLKQNEALFAGGSLSEDQKDMFFEAVSRAYIMNKQHAREKFGRKDK